MSRMQTEAIRIDRLTTAADFHACEELQQRVWGSTDTDIVPLHLLITVQMSGGLVLGAFDEDGRMIGFLVGFLGARDGDIRRPKHCSHMMGVLEEARGRGVGYRLKLAQREHALGQGLDLVTWTYDPLESLNAALNIGKLGAVCNTYVRDLYGPMTDDLNAGLSTDRFQVEWWIESGRVTRCIAGGRTRSSLAEALEGGGVLLNQATVGSDGLLRPSSNVLPPGGRRVLAEIPAQVQRIKATDIELAHRWRAHTREIFEACFAAGYTVADFVSEAQDALRRSYYVLERDFEVI